MIWWIDKRLWKWSCEGYLIDTSYEYNLLYIYILHLFLQYSVQVYSVLRSLIYLDPSEPADYVEWQANRVCIAFSSIERRVVHPTASHICTEYVSLILILYFILILHKHTYAKSIRQTALGFCPTAPFPSLFAVFLSSFSGFHHHIPSSQYWRDWLLLIADYRLVWLSLSSSPGFPVPVRLYAGLYLSAGMIRIILIAHVSLSLLFLYRGFWTIDLSLTLTDRNPATIDQLFVPLYYRPLASERPSLLVPPSPGYRSLWNARYVIR